MKKIIAVLLLCLTVIVVCTACGRSQHIHSAQPHWARNAQQHWHECACGEQHDVQAHSMKDGSCTVCGSEIRRFDDGTADVCNYNEYGEITRRTMLDAQGTVTAEYTYGYRYDENGNKLYSQAYRAGSLSEEMEYAQGFSGEYIVKERTLYQDKMVRTQIYDGHGNCINASVRSPEGKLYFQEHIQYTYDAHMKVIESEARGYNVSGIEYVHITNQYGDRIRETTYDTDGKVLLEYIMEYAYDAGGNMIHKKSYKNGVLESEWELIVQDSGAVYTESYVYEEDGTKIFYCDNQYGDTVMTVRYDAQGRMLSEEICEYEYAETGEMLRERIYMDKVLTYEFIYSIESGIHYRQQMIEYLDGGSRAVYEYGENGDFKGMTVFDASETIIQRYDSQGKIIE